MASSRFLRELQDTTRKKTHELVLRLLPVKEDDENYSIAMDFCISNFNPRYHSFPDVNPKDVQVVYDSLAARLEHHQQLDKARRLLTSVSQLNALELEGARQDTGAALLSLIFNLAGQPLTSPALTLDPTPPTQPRTTPPLRLRSSRIHDPPTLTPHPITNLEETPEPSSDDETESVRSVASHLSDWDSPDEDPSRVQQSTSVSPDHHPLYPPGTLLTDGSDTPTRLTADGPGLGSTGPHARTTLPVGWAPGDVPSTNAPRRSLVPPRSSTGGMDVPLSETFCPDLVPVLADARPQDLVPCLARCRLGGAGFMGPQRALCMTDQYIVQQVCNLFVCDTSKCFVWQSQALPPPTTSTSPTPCDLTPRGHYVSLRGVHTPHLSPALITDMLGRFATTGNQIAAMRALIRMTEAPSLDPKDNTQPSSTPATVLAPIPLTPTAAALLQGMAAQLHHLLRPVVELQQLSRFEHLQEPPHQTRFCLLQVHLMLEGFMRQVHALHDVVHGTMECYVAALRQALAVTAVDPAKAVFMATSNAADGGVGTGGGVVMASTRMGMTFPQAEAAAGTGGVVTMPQGPAAGGRDGSDGERRAGGKGLPGPEGCAFASSVLLDAVQERLEVAGCGGGPQGQAAQQRLLHLFCCALEPMLMSLHAWLFDGLDSELMGDFFIVTAKKLPETDPLFWTDAHKLAIKPFAGAPHEKGVALRPAAQQQTPIQATDANTRPSKAPAQPPQQVACPRFLQPYAQQLFSAGKALRLLHNGRHATTTTTTDASSLLAAVPGLLLQPSQLPTQHAVPSMLAPHNGHNTHTRHTTTTSTSKAHLTHRVTEQLLSFLGNFTVTTAPSTFSAPPSTPRPQPSTPATTTTTTSHPQAPHIQPIQPVMYPSQESPITSRANTIIGDASYFGAMASAGQAMGAGQLWVGGHDTGEVRPRNPSLAWSPGALDSSTPAAASHSAPHTPTRVVGGAVRTSVDLSSGLQGHGHSSTPLAPRQQGVGSTPARKESGKARGGVAGAHLDGDSPADLTVWVERVEGAMMADAPALGWQALAMRGDQLSSQMGATQQQHASCLANNQVPRLLPQTHPHLRLEWLLDQPCLDLPPLDMVLDKCLIGDIKQQAQLVEQQLMGCLLSNWGLMAELSALRNLYLLAAPAAQAWANRLLLGLIKGQALMDLNEFELEVSLQDACMESLGGPASEVLPAIDCLGLVLDKEGIVDGRKKGMDTRVGGDGPDSSPPMPLGGLYSVRELEGLQVHYQPSWLMSILGGKEALKPYRQALVFLLQINVARMSLERTRQRSWKFWQSQAELAGQLTTHARQAQAAGSAHTIGQRPTGLSSYLLQQHQQQAWDQITMAQRQAGGAGKQQPVQQSAVQLQRQDELALQEMMHFVNNLHQYVMDRLLYGAWLKLEQGLDKAQSLDEMVRCHQTFLADLEHHSGHSENTNSWRHLVLSIIKILDQVIRYCAAQQRLMAELEKMSTNSAQAVVVPSAANPPPPSSQSLELVPVARRQMAEACQELKKFLTYSRNFMVNTTTKLGGDSEIYNLLMLINFNGWYGEA